MCLASRPVGFAQNIPITGVTRTTYNRKSKRYLGEIKMNWLKRLVDKVRLEIRYRKKLKELRKRDPFIYK